MGTLIGILVPHKRFIYSTTREEARKLVALYQLFGAWLLLASTRGVSVLKFMQRIGSLGLIRFRCLLT